MKSTQILRTNIGGRKVDTSLIEDKTYRYYETATWNPSEKVWDVHDWSRVDTPELAALMHERAVEYADKAQHYEER